MLSLDWTDVVREVVRHLPAVLAVVTFRAVPILLYILYKSPGVVRRALVVSLFGLAVLGIHRGGIPVLELIVGAPLASAYFTLLALAVHRAPPLIRRRALTKAATFGLLVVACLIVPAVVIPEPYVLTGLIVSWEVMLAAYSYCVDVAASTRAVTAREAVFFIVVNPAVVYAEGGEAGLERGRWKGVLRVGLGALTLVLQDAILVALSVQAFQPFDLTSVRSVDGYAHFMGANLALFAGLYAAHSGLASVQIGLLRLIGVRIPERYTFPCLARRHPKSPHERSSNSMFGPFGLTAVCEMEAGEVRA